MKWIGLTGGIGTGKSTVADLLRDSGYSVIDADELAKEAVKKNSPGLQSVLAEFGPGLQTKDGELDRSSLAQMVFKSPEKLARLEKIIHPIVRKLAEERREALEKKGKKCAFYDVPLLFEKNMESMFDSVVVVTSSEKNQIERLKSRTAWSEKSIRERIASQLPLLEKIKKADFVIQNDSSIDELKLQIKKMLETINLS